MKEELNETKRRSISLNSDMENELQRENDIVTSFLSMKDIPPWFRGTSAFQIEACDALLNAIRDDTEQSTSHRVSRCLDAIGLDPSICSKDTKFLMRLSRGNDLAFLWFLMEIHYKTPGIGYSVNEQVIMSSIAHLDMLTTIRELDRILPPGHPSLKYLEHRKKLEEGKRAKTKKNKPKEKYVLPYFESLRRPREFGKPLNVSPPDFAVTLDKYYSNFRNASIPNEINRWYANYNLRPGTRIAHRIIKDEIENIFENCNNCFDKTEKFTSLCERHKVVNELEKSLENQLKVIAREQCLKHLDVDKNRREASHKRVMEQLERDTNLYLCKFRKLAEKTKKQTVVQLINDDGCCQLAIDDDELESEGGSHEQIFRNKNDCYCWDKDEGSCDAEIYGVPNKENCHRHDANCNRQIGTAAAGGDGLDIGSSNELVNGNGTNKVKQRVSISGYLGTINKAASYMSIGNYNYGHGNDATPTSSQIFFEGPADHKPYQFDYSKIFHFDNEENSAEKPNIKKTIIQAIDSSVVIQNKNSGLLPTVDETVKNAAKKIWKQEVARKMAELQEPERIAENETQKLYDCEDKELMHNMLKDALEQMSTNPKFVLASMPEAYKMPLLREWIYGRYGKKYTKAERYKSFRLSLRMFHALDKITLRVPLPSARQLGTQLFVDYSCRDYLLKKSRHIKRQYYKRLDSAIMEQARVFWFAMRPYLCSNGPPRNTYFAYMPSRVMDITRFRLWKPTEFMNAKAEWERRNCQKNKKQGAL